MAKSGDGDFVVTTMEGAGWVYCGARFSVGAHMELIVTDSLPWREEDNSVSYRTRAIYAPGTWASIRRKEA